MDKTNSTCTEFPNVKGKTIEPLEDSIREYLFNLRTEKDFVKQDAKLQIIKKKIMFDYVKVRNLCSSFDESETTNHKLRDKSCNI